MIQWAYNIRDFQLSGEPAWAGNLRYDVMAKSGTNDGPVDTPSSPASTSDGAWSIGSIRLKLQALLADRFHLTLHREPREMAAYALVVGKNGSKLKENNGSDRDWMDRGRGRLKGTHVDMRFLAVTLSRQVDRVVLDETGLKGNYDFELNWIPEVRSGAQASAAAPPDAAPPAPDGPSIFVAIQEQLGLKLEPKKGPVPVFIIDHAEKPADN